VKIDWAAAEEAPLVQELVDRHWKRGHVLARDEALLRWQYRVPGDEDRLSVLVARDGERPVGFLGVIRTPFCRHGETLRGGWLATWTVAEEARETQAGLALLLEALRDFDVVGCLGFNEQAEAIYRRLGFEVRTPLPRYVALEPSGASASARDWDDRAWAERWRDEIAPSFVGAARDAAFIRWRYLEHPTYRYVVRLAEDARALVVHRVQEVEGRRVVRFVEALGDADAAAALIGLALHEAEGAWLADFTCVDEAYAEPFVRAGFVPETSLPEPPPDRFQPLGRSPRGLGAAFHGVGLAGLYATRADGDQDRPS
jgi:hypothetical protein